MATLKSYIIYTLALVFTAALEAVAGETQKILHWLTDIENTQPRPMVIWHGLGDTYDADGLIEVEKIAKVIHPGIFVHRIYVDEDSGKDRTATFYGDTNVQVEAVCSQLRSIPELSRGFDAMGFSQGGVFLRAYLERCNTPPVRNFVTFGSPHNGVASFDVCRGADFLCRSAMELLRRNAWSNYVQSHIVPAQYFRDPNDVERYRNCSSFLADINGESAMTKRNNTYRRHMASLEHLVLFKFLKDETLIPPESSWFAEYNATSNSSIPLEKRDIYTQDWIGLKALGEAGHIHFKEIDGPHMQISDRVLSNVIETYFGKRT